MKIKKFSKLLSVGLAFALCLAPVNTGFVSAAENNATQRSTLVTCEVGAYFDVSIPKTVQLSPETKSASYSITVKGEIPLDDNVSVSPKDDIADMDGINFYMSKDTARNADVPATVSQDGTAWNYDEVLEGAAKNGSISAPGLTPGSWEGNLVFEIVYDGDAVIGGGTEEGPGGEDDCNHTYVDGVCTNCGGMDPDYVPSVSDFEDGSSYETGKSITVKDGETVTVNGSVVELTNNSYTFNEAGDYTVVITSPNGNSTTLTVTIQPVQQSQEAGLYMTGDVMVASYDDIVSYGFDVQSDDENANWTSFVASHSDLASGTKLVLPDYVKHIGNKKFYQAANLTDIVMPNGLASIGNESFRHCSGLTSASIPDSVTAIGGFAFGNSDNIIKAHLPKNIESLGAGCFFYCTKLSSVEIPDTLTAIPGSTFNNCGSLTSCELPDAVTSIGAMAFLNCTSLKNIQIPDAVTQIGSEAFSNCTSLENVNIPNAVTSIGSRAFENCSKIKEAVIPDGVTSINDMTFSGCTSLTNVVLPDALESIGGSAFKDTKLTEIVIPDSLGTADSEKTGFALGTYAFNGCDSLRRVVLPDGLRTITMHCFEGCTNLESINIPDSVTLIYKYAFSGCANLRTVNIPNGVTYIEEYTFSGCAGLESVDISDGVKSISEYAFSECTNADINIPNSVTFINMTAFTNVPHITYHGSYTYNKPWGALSIN